VYSSSHEDYNDESTRVRRRRDLRNDNRDVKLEASKFVGNLNLESHLDWFNLRRGSLSLRRTMMKNLSRWLFPCILMIREFKEEKGKEG